MNLADFTRREAAGLAFYSCRALDGIPRVRHAFSTRHDRASRQPFNLSRRDWDSDRRVEQNCTRFLQAVGLDPRSLAMVSQVHSDRFHIINRGATTWNPKTEGDALVTFDSAVSVAVRVADCFPVLMADAETGAVAAVHAGWRGMLARICRKTVEGMIADRHTNPERLLVAVGPGIRQCCFEVGTEIADAYRKEFGCSGLSRPHPESPGKEMLDLGCALLRQLEEAGIPSGNVFDLNGCTRCRVDEFFSHRAEEQASGRMMAVIGRVE